MISTSSFCLKKLLRHFVLNVLVATGIFFLLPLLSFGRMSAYAAVVINEIYPKPEDKTAEWIELYNTGSEKVSLNLWKLENTNGEKILNASNNIEPHGFLTLKQSQTNITLSDLGDTVNLYDDHETKVDSESYASTIGVNRSAGRSTDGTGPWSEDCTVATYDTPNNCIAPTSTPTPLPTPVFTNTPIPSIAPPVTDAPVSAVAPTAPIPAERVVLGVAYTPSPTPTPSGDEIIIEIPKVISVSKMTAMQIIVVASVWTFIALIAFIRNRLMRRHRLKKVPPTAPPAST